MSVSGSCLCGAVLFEIDPEGVALSVACHCSNCRKVSGSGYGVYLQVRPAAFRWLAGEQEVATFESSPGNRRGFCQACGSVAPVATAYGVVRVPGGLLDQNLGRGPDVVLFEADRAPWCDAAAETPRFPDGGPPSFWRQALAGQG
jgi:hypothetical protein